MSTQPFGNKLPSSYSLPPPPPPSSIGKGNGRGRGKSRGSGSFQPLYRQNNQPGSNQQNSQLFESTYSLSETKKYSPQEQFSGLLDSFNKSIFDNVQNLRKSFEEKYSIPHLSNNISGDKYQNLSLLNKESLNKKGKQLNINDQASSSRSNFSQANHPVEQNSKTTSSRSNNTSSSQLKKQISPDDVQHQVNFAAVAKAALAATSALQYNKHNSAKDCKSNNQR